jgi:hypothetical protein
MMMAIIVGTKAVPVFKRIGLQTDIGSHKGYNWPQKLDHELRWIEI